MVLRGSAHLPGVPWSSHEGRHVKQSVVHNWLDLHVPQLRPGEAPHVVQQRHPLEGAHLGQVGIQDHRQQGERLPGPAGEGLILQVVLLVELLLVHDLQRQEDP